MTDFTPTTTQVRDAYVRGMRNAFIASAVEHEQEFDRWLESERLPIATIRNEYARYQQHGDLHELARAIGQVLGTVAIDDGPDWIVNPQPVQRPLTEDE